MTIPSERTWAVDNTRNFLFALLDPKKTPRVPRDVRQMASRCLRHYPGHMDMVQSFIRLPEVWGPIK